MDDTQPNQPVAQPVQQPVATPVVQPVSPVGGPAHIATPSVAGGPKEARVIPGVPVTEWVSPSTPEIVLPQEVKDAGVEAKPVVQTISEDAQQAGARMAHSSMSVPTIAVETLNIETPRSVLHQLKQAHKKVTDSLSWLVRLIIKEQDKRAKETA